MDKSKQVVLSGQLKWVERIASVMDDKFKVPGTNFRFGLDPILNLIPFAGDVSGFIVSAALLYVMAKNGVSRKVLILMTINISIDAIVGAIPPVRADLRFLHQSKHPQHQTIKRTLPRRQAHRQRQWHHRDIIDSPLNSSQRGVVLKLPAFTLAIRLG